MNARAASNETGYGMTIITGYVGDELASVEMADTDGNELAFDGEDLQGVYDLGARATAACCDPEE